MKPQPVAASSSSAHGRRPVSIVNMHRPRPFIVWCALECSAWALPLPSVPFHFTFQSFLSAAFGSEKPAPNVSFHDAEPAVWRPGVGSAMYVTPISEVKRVS